MGIKVGAMSYTSGSSKVGSDPDLNPSSSFDETYRTTFPVSVEELAIIKAEMYTEFPEEASFLSDAYITSVASKPYSKNPEIRRPIEYTLSKLRTLLTYRTEHLCSVIPGMLSCNSGLRECLARGSLYVRGVDKQGRSIIWVRTEKKPWYVSDVSAEVNLHILMSDFAISTMPANVTDFVVVSDSSSPPPPSPSFLIEMIKGLVKGYPDRLNKLYSAPMGGVLSTVMSLLLPMMPGALSSKIVLYQTKEEMHATLKDVLYGGENDIPDFFGGQCKHDDIFNGEHLDWKKMKEVHQACRDKFIEENGK